MCFRRKVRGCYIEILVYFNMNNDFAVIYLSYYPKLLRFATEYVLLKEDAENIVQDLFVSLWENKYLLANAENLNAYLFKLVRNRCIDFLRVKIREKDRNLRIQEIFEIELKLKLDSLEDFDKQGYNEDNLARLISEAINSLPERCRQIFVMSKIEKMKYNEIADQLNLSINTIEKQVGIALKKLRIKLKKQ